VGPKVALLESIVAQSKCYATITSDNIGARMTKDATMTLGHIITTTYVMCLEEYLWNVSVLQRVHLSNLLIIEVGIRLIAIVATGFNSQNYKALHNFACCSFSSN
jgi:hypothetical protein